MWIRKGIFGSFKLFQVRPLLHLGTLYPRRPGLFFSFRGPAPNEAVMRLGFSLCSMRARVYPIRVCKPPTSLPQLHCSSRSKAWLAPPLPWHHCRLIEVSLAVRYSSTQARQETPRPFLAQRRPAGRTARGINQPSLHPELGSLDAWKLQELQRVLRVARELVLACNTGPG